MLIRNLLDRVEGYFEDNISLIDKEITGAYIKGLIDSEGHIYNSGRIVISMRPTPCLELASGILDNIGIKHRIYEYPHFNMNSLTIYGPINQLIELCCPVIERKSNVLLNCTQLLRMG